MNKWIFIVVASLLVGSAALAANSSGASLVSPSEIEDAVNAMDSQTFQSYRPIDYECWAHNERGRHFRAFGRFPESTQRVALNECYRYSRSCFADGCRPL